MRVGIAADHGAFSSKEGAARPALRAWHTVRIQSRDVACVQASDLGGYRGRSTDWRPRTERGSAAGAEFGVDHVFSQRHGHGFECISPSNPLSASFNRRSLSKSRKSAMPWHFSHMHAPHKKLRLPERYA